ncbi:MAG: hypothetical protein HUU35_08475 [Armatimonadetes bacterium]|nr:hypothetical protein [Armatimonadota bacterium]
MLRHWGALLIAVVCLGAGSAKDYTADWRFMGIVQPQVTVGPRQEPNFRWRRIRGIATGPITENLKAKFQVNLDPDTGFLSLMDAFLDYTPIKAPVRLNLQGGLLMPYWAMEGGTFANTVNYSYMVALLRLWERTAGVQATARFANAYELTGAILNGAASFNDNNELPNYLLSVTTVQPWFDARAWYYKGKDGPYGAETSTDITGCEITNARVGRFTGNAAFIGSNRRNVRMLGGYVEAMYQLSKQNSVIAKFDWADANRDQPARALQRYIGCYRQRLTPWMDSFWEVEYDQKLNDANFLFRGDARF